MVEDIPSTLKGLRKEALEFTIPIGPRERKWFIKRKDIYQYLDETFFSSYALWKRWKRFGLPYNNGWAFIPNRILEAIEVIEEEYNYKSRSK